MFRLIKRAPWIALGAAGAWFFEPSCGPQRRAEARRKLEDILGSPGTTTPPTTLHDEMTDPLHERATSRATTG